MKLRTINGHRFSALAIILLISCFLRHNSVLLSAEPNPEGVGISTHQRKISGGYCGIYCLYGAMRFFGKDCDPNELIRQEYIGSSKGSSLAELKKAVVDHGLYAMPVKRLTMKDLRGLSMPVIIHVKSSLSGPAYDHYELFLGTIDGRALIYDPPNPAELVQFTTLAPRWDGSALLVSDKPIDLGTIFALARKRFVIYAVIAIAVVLVVRWGHRRFLSINGAVNRKKMLLISFGQCAALILTATVCAILYHSIDEEGLLICREATASVQEAHRANFIPKISTSRAHRLLKSGEAVFIDPRPDFAFKTSHIRDAINIPPETADDDHVKITDQIAKNARIIIYCRREDYLQAGALAVKLQTDGFTNVRIYKGNWIQWATSKKGY